MRLHSIMPLPQISLPTVEKREKTRKSATAEKNTRAKADVFRIPPSPDEFDQPDDPGGHVDILV